MQIQKYENLNPNSLQEVLTCNSAPLVTLHRANKKEVIMFIDALLTEFCSIYKLDESKIMTESEQIQCTDILIKDYYYLKQEDLMLFLKNCKRGLYGKPFGSVDMPFFFQCLEQYCETRISVASEQNRVKAIEAKREPISEETQKMINDLKEKLKPRREYAEPPKREKTEQELLVESWITEFKLKTGEVTTKGFLNVDGKMLGINEYLEYKLKEHGSEKENL